MAAGEFELIDRHFRELGARRGDVVLGVGDDAALLDAGPARALRVAWSCRTAAADGDAGGLGEACVEEATRRLREAGATPAWATVGLSLEHADEDWTAHLARGIARACAREGIAVVGGDTTAGPTTAVTVFVTGPRGPDGAR